jgi:hypothetical protein
MRVNFIGDFKTGGVCQDARFITENLKETFGEENVEVFNVSNHFPECNEADINIFFDLFNPSLVAYAEKNIWVINHEWAQKNAASYLPLADEVWTRSEQTFQILMNISVMYKEVYFEKVRWTSFDKQYAQIKNYSKALVLVGRNSYRSPGQLFKAYCEIKDKTPDLYKKLPSLTVPYVSTFVNIRCPEEIEDKVTLVDKFLSEKEYDELLQESGLAICISVCDSFSHSVNEAMSSGCNMLLAVLPPFKEIGCDEVLYTEISRIVTHPRCIGNMIESSVDSIIECLEKYVERDFDQKKEASMKIRERYEINHVKAVKESKKLFKDKFEKIKYSLKETLPLELPYMSVMTLLKDRPKFIELVKYCYSIQIYPPEKLEWVIVDDGKVSSELEFKDIENVKYIYLENEHTIGQKRNIAVEQATHDILVVMDDDDVYNEKSLIQRASMMLKTPEKECAFCTTIPCYDIENDKSFMSLPSPLASVSECVSEATLIFTKKFWLKNKFGNLQSKEGTKLIGGREPLCRVLSPKDILVSLLHSSNAFKRDTPPDSNGCHYKFSEEVQKILSLDKNS